MNKIPEWVFEYHGHKCPAMPIGYRAGLVAMEKLGVEKAGNKELYLVSESGPEHATACFLDGVIAATGCTPGKGNVEKRNHGKNAITLIDLKTKNAVRVVMNPDFHKKALTSEFVKLRKQGIEPKDIEPSLVNFLIDNIMKTEENNLFKIGEIHKSSIKRPKGTFNWHECDICGEVVFENTVKMINGKLVCTPCFENN